MSTGEHQIRLEALAQNPELLRDVENAWNNISGAEETLRHDRTDVQFVGEGGIRTLGTGVSPYNGLATGLW
jgi:hypothetical protein